ncbi:uncharacterized protein LOC116669464 [Etheostoma spectabile]|uniref:uncharacterized protein LOC116669464 n=1 Tax=Etheostoma spectabile TaxID=54343 RepID=UPI0013AEF314|nr:uncharacterized protein LOC116669464 [Etheostoma spectabile]
MGMAQHTELVAHRERDVWKPSEDYKDRINESAVLAFSRMEYTDTGLYELTCGVRFQRFQLQVVLASEVFATEGGNAILPCYITGEHEVIKWSRGREIVLEVNLSSGETKYGPGFNKRMSLSPDGKKKRNWALILEPVLPEDGGDYFCSFHQNGAEEGRGDPPAVRMRVAERTRNQTTGCPSLNTSESVPQETAMQHWAVFGKVAVAIGSIIPLILLILLVWWVKSRHSDASPPQANGCSPLMDARAESPV